LSEAEQSNPDLVGGKNEHHLIAVQDKQMAKVALLVSLVF